MIHAVTAVAALVAVILAAPSMAGAEISVPGAASSAVAGEAAPSPLRSVPRVLERFEIGEGVYARALAIDARRASLWVGTSVGVIEVALDTRSPRNTFTRADGLANEYVFAIAVDREGYKWFGTNGGGMSRYREGAWKTFFPMHGLADYWVYSFASQRDGTLWVGTWAGATRMDAATGELRNYVHQLVNEWVYGVAVDSRDRVWFGTEGGVSMFDGRVWQSWTHEDGVGAPNEAGLPPSKNTGLGTRSRHDLGVLRGGRPTYNPGYVFAIHVDPDDTVWVATWGGGVSRFDGRAWRSYTTVDGLPSNIVYSIARTPDGSLWFGTAAGVSVFDGRHWQTLDALHGGPGGSVYALVAAPDGDVWAGARGEVLRIGR